MEDRNSLVSVQINTNGEDVATWALPEGAIARLGRGGVRDMAFSPDGQYFAVGTSIGLWLYELPTLSPIALWDTERGITGNVTFSPDSRRIVTSTFNENVKIWDVQSGVCIAQMPKLDNQEVCQPVFFPRWTTPHCCQLPHEKWEDSCVVLTHWHEDKRNGNTASLQCLSALLFSGFKFVGR